MVQPQHPLRNMIMAFVFLLCSEVLSAQAAPPLVWQQTYGGTADEIGNSMVRTPDQGYVVAGFTISVDGDVSGQHGSRDLWAFKIDSTGTIQWQQTLGDVSWDEAHEVCRTTDGGYVLAGSMVPYPVLYNNAWAVKLDSAGNVLWDHPFGGSGNENLWSVTATSDGGSIAIGFTESNDGDVTGNHGGQDVWVLKLDPVGALQWQHCYGGTMHDWGKAILQAADGGYILLATAMSNDADVSGNHGGSDPWLVKLDPAGTIEWQHTYGGTSSEDAFAVCATSDGGYVFVARTNSVDGDVSGNHGGGDCWVVKVDATGTLQWQHCFGGTLMDTPLDIVQLHDGGYAFTGNVYSSDGDVVGSNGGQDFWVARLDAGGALVWQKPMGGSDGDSGGAIVPLPSGHFMLAGMTQSDDGDVQGFIGVRDVWLVELGEEDLSTAKPEQTGVSDLAIAPNPVNGWCQVSGAGLDGAHFAVADVLGKVVLSGTFASAQKGIDLQVLPAGHYLLTVRSSGTSRSVRIVRE
ncbi:MAG: T9SS type A sorting domain-containing protein [Flavobacteriales bacterium]|nr:T9SS type A sorting domain-containing protein [Flavobacteriales bacterium]